MVSRAHRHVRILRTATEGGSVHCSNDKVEGNLVSIRLEYRIRLYLLIVI